ncbi:FdhF/YdeP family oxidoreductase [Caballeronia sp. LZ016]|uniref:FdhF/YdeP family oxidoreductase n=3 Tax=unclassified Caballeronia TaxID=2646786 RepID=UPI002860CAF5|nr:FdhF/YdeP family oxidoreductase [Caballeronia sp. LZ016]MDR5741413.1 FdhF/YdeP family oxidoreductase [Caballeronia sp. LZ016]
MSKREVPGVGPYGGPAGGWGALQAVARALKHQMGVAREATMLLKVNQPAGFDCPGCAWPDPRSTSSFEFCENGAKAVSWEATTKRTTPEFFARHKVSELWAWNDHALEDEGRLTHPMRYDAQTGHYVPVSWDEAFERIGAALRALPDPHMAEFYTSGRASNEAAFLYQLFARRFGTNNFPDCSNMCHEPTSVGLPEAIGVGKGTVTLADFDHCDAIFCIGHNPGTNHPRMLATLRSAARRGAKIVVLNPLKERGLERFASPQDPVEMVTGRSTAIATDYVQVRIGGDVAFMKGMMKTVLALHRDSLSKGGEGVLDRAFIDEHTEGLDEVIADLDATAWSDIVGAAGIERAEIERIGKLYAGSKAVIACYGMGITQHHSGTANVQQIVNLLLMRGNMGRDGAGICPLRGHSNVQGDRTVGITEVPPDDMLDSIERVFKFAPPREHGHGAITAIEAMRDGRSKALICLGGNLPVAMSDTQVCFDAMRKLDLAVHIATKLNRSHLLTAKETFILPCLGRTELDVQASGPQTVTVEDSMSMVHASRGSLPPASGHLLSEPAIVARMAKATLDDASLDWDGWVADYSRIRDLIEAVFPQFDRYNDRIQDPGGFRLFNAAAARRWNTPGGRARFIAHKGVMMDPRVNRDDALILATIRSHDQYNTTIYGFNDRYRGITGRRDVVFVNERDLEARGLQHGDLVDLETIESTVSVGGTRRLCGLTAVAFDIAPGSIAAYYPEANCLVSLADNDPRSGTPSYKSIPVLLSLSRGDCEVSADAQSWHQGDVPNDKTGATVAAETPEHRRQTGTPS